MILCVDDIGEKYEKNLHRIDEMKIKVPSLKITAFVVAERLTPKVLKWLKQDWIEVGLHCWNHDPPPEGEREDFEKRTRKALTALSPLMNRMIYRPAGFQILASNYPILEKLGIEVIVHSRRIQLLKEKKSLEVNLVNTHIYDEFKNVPKGEFQFISEVV